MTRFYDLLGATAHDLLDPEQPANAQPTLDHRKVAALGIIADGAGATTRTTAYLHIDLTDLPEPLVRMGKVEKLGPLTIAKIREWLGTSRFTLQPVLDLARADGARPARPAGVDARARCPSRPHLRPYLLLQAFA